MAKKIREEVRAIDEGKPSLLAATMRKLGIRRVVVRTWAGRFGGVKDVAWDPLADIRLHT
jgi:ribosomal protein S14